jgi:hypothetical protein
MPNRNRSAFAAFAVIAIVLMSWAAQAQRPPSTPPKASKE